MTMVFDESERRIASDEGCKLKPYKCPAGKLTLGWGRNIEERGISKEEADFMFKNDMKEVRASLRPYGWYNTLSLSRQAVLENMVFNMGISRLLGFKKMIEALKNKDFNEAAEQIIDSNAAKQLQNRYQRLARSMRIDQFVDKY